MQTGAADSSWSSITVSFDTTMAGGKWLLVSYSSDKPVLVSLDQTGLADSGASYEVQLPASSDTIVCIRIDTATFHQPDWVGAKTAMNLAEVRSISISPATASAATNLTITRMVVFGTGSLFNVVATKQRIASTIRPGVNFAGGLFHVTVPSSGLWHLSIFRPDGKLVSSQLPSECRNADDLCADRRRCLPCKAQRLRNEICEQDHHTMILFL